MKNIKLYLIITCSVILSFFAGFVTLNKVMVKDKECFKTIVQERDFLFEANRYKWELIIQYDGLINAKDSIEKQFYEHQLDSLWNL